MTELGQNFGLRQWSLLGWESKNLTRVHNVLLRVGKQNKLR